MNVNEDHLQDSTFVIISEEKFSKFKELQKENDRLRAQLEHHMKYRPIVQPTTLKTGEGNQTCEQDKLSSQINQSPSNVATDQFSQPQLIQTIVSQVLHLLKPSANLQAGAGTDGLLDDVADPLPPESSPTFTANQALLDQHYNKNTEDVESINDSSDDDSFNATDQKLLNSVAPFRRPKARKFLSAIKEHRDIFSYSADGTIYIDGQALEQSNFFKLFPYLFKPAHFSSHPHLREVVNELATLGLGHLISRFYTAGLSPRGKNFIHNRATVHKEIKSLGPDWYKINHD